MSVTTNRTRSLSCRMLTGAMLLAAWTCLAAAQQSPPPPAEQKKPFDTLQEYNRRLDEIRRLGSAIRVEGEYRIGPEDLLDLTVFEAPEMNRSLRVSAGGEISLPLLGAVRAAGLTPRELELVLSELLRRSFMKDPHVGVFVRELQSRPVSVFGAVFKPGVFQVRGTRTLVEVLSLAEGLAADAGDTVLVLRGAGRTGLEKDASGNEPQPETIEVSLKRLIESGDPRVNVPVYPGDIVKVTRAGIVYVVGEVRKPGGFTLKSNENITVLQALALAEGLTRTSARGQTRIIRTDEVTGKRVELPVNLDRVLAGKAEDPMLRAKDIVFVPNSAGRNVLYRGAEAALAVATGVIIWRR